MWSSGNCLSIHQTKSKIVASNGKASAAISVPYTLVPSIKDIGVTNSKDFTWNTHISNLWSKMNSGFHFLRKTVPFGVSTNLKMNTLETYDFSMIFFSVPVRVASIGNLRNINFSERISETGLCESDSQTSP